MSDNRREFFRVAFDHLINGEISIEGGAFTRIKIDNISVGGMSFVSEAQFFMHEKVECRFTILERSFLIKGVIVRKSIKLNYTEYGVEFEIDQETASTLFQQLNFYQIRQRRKGDH
ncbi:PilZ domain-containing protein [Mesobacillus maritimus]|uniref:PilZ domain-containing protein n=1 Tax=Mesobacillus maritimus TaxID=1643336 RepID=UPI00384D689B